MARQAGCGPNPGRQMALGAGLPVTIPALTVNQACASGLTALQTAVRCLQLGEAEAVLVVGAESMSNVPYLLPEARWGQRMGHRPLVDAMYRDGLLCPLCDQIMGETVDALAHELAIGRAEADAWALRSQQLAAASPAKAELCQLPELCFDEHPRADTSVESLARLRPVFGDGGVCTAGNSSGITDGAASLVLISETARRRFGVQPLARYLGGVTVGLEPARMGLGPVGAMRAYHARQGDAPEDYAWFEINEAFAAQVLACQRELQLPEEKLNPRGGAIALGHPIGCSGARLVVTMIHGLRAQGGGRGLASLCVSGGLGIASGFEVAGQ